MNKPQQQGAADLVGLLIGAPLAVIGILVSFVAGSTSAAILGSAVLLSGVMLVCSALLIRGLRRP
ncbi:hypothetical protein DEJ16_03685 [Curtobacterium sp. MCJR17_055]|uniref:hypothetical protein n=1 Tax=unclassified Curtobacterium TaxID=257496 RepID=UPI000D8E1641|nr:MULTISPECIES: hypothetical protein [unclassified Curtobacterium]PYY33758.1 hypothetical protein DEI87_10875 [Curtobacterium sp. MCBD17_029]PYY48235.1 hypothetical protein DEI84_09565 [Curtobacterium sp. MCBD17_023]PYY58772.1 hypothetical protein DEJ16_03685 [Curtobacterium sp. MCJR17_055]PYY59687.1 hypothetical protein DEJ26_07220 [Curtobacterium sp. MCPF17_015]PZE91732.1 hypothetical protein DEI95_10225 [Curtobacterium sp. MCBD17_008]